MPPPPATQTHVTRVVLLPFAGGHSYSYRPLVAAAPPGLKLICPELPGRGRRMPTPLLTDLEVMVQDLLETLEPPEAGPWLLFGHSMGALLALLLARRLRALGRGLPAGLVVSGLEGPSVLERHQRRHLLPLPQFRREVREMGGSPPEILDNPEFFAFFEPILRADFQAVETYVHQPEPSLDLDITVLRGSNDTVSLAQAQAWQRESRRPIALHSLPGGHFFIFDHIPWLLRLLATHTV